MEIQAFHGMDDDLFSWEKPVYHGLGLLGDHKTEIRKDVWEKHTDAFYDKLMAIHDPHNQYHCTYYFRRIAEFDLFADGEWEPETGLFGVPIWDL